MKYDESAKGEVWNPWNPWNPLESLELEWLEWLQSGKVSIPIPPGRHDCVLKFQVHR